MIGSNTTAHNQSRAVGSTSSGDSLRHVDLSTIRTTVLDVGANWDSIGPVCRLEQWTGLLDYSPLAAIILQMHTSFTKTAETRHQCLSAWHWLLSWSGPWLQQSSSCTTCALLLRCPRPRRSIVWFCPTWITWCRCRLLFEQPEMLTCLHWITIIPYDIECAWCHMPPLTATGSRSWYTWFAILNMYLSVLNSST